VFTGLLVLIEPLVGVESAAQRVMMATNVTQVQNAIVRFAGEPRAANGLALVRMTIGAMLVWVFFENLGKGAYTPAGYAGVINYYIKASHSPAAWKWVMGLIADHAGLAAPMQAATEISLGIMLVIGLLTRPFGFIAFLFLASLWVSEWGTSWIWELLVPVLASLGLAVGRAGRAWGIDALLARRPLVSVVVMSESACDCSSCCNHRFAPDHRIVCLYPEALCIIRHDIHFVH
jgi:uncharacterized membrane protein YphA (DoxX/SURF4 family)